MAEYINRNELLERMQKGYCGTCNNYSGILCRSCLMDDALRDIEDAPAADVVEVDSVSEQIIRKKAEVSDYWQRDVKQYRAMQGYSDIEHDADNFLRGYNEAVEDMLAILDGERREVCEKD